MARRRMGPAQLQSYSTCTQLSAATPLLSQFLDVATSISVCTAARLVHGDLKSDNVVIMQDGSAAVVDCGQCWSLPPTHDSSPTTGGTLNYQAPELMDCTVDGEDSVGSSAADVFALTVMFCELLSRWVTPIFAALMPELPELLQWGLSTNPEQRPTAQQLVVVLEAGKVALREYQSSSPESVTKLAALLATPAAQASQLELADLQSFVNDVRFELTYQVRDYGLESVTSEHLQAAWLSGDAVFLRAPQLASFIHSTVLPWWSDDVGERLTWLQEGLFETEEVMLRVKAVMEGNAGFRTLQQAAADDPDGFAELYASEEKALHLSHQLLPGLPSPVDVSL